MSRRSFSRLMTTAAALLALLGHAGLKAAPKPAPPNIVFILADDLGYGDLGCYGQQQIRTPNLDALATQGVRFTQAYAGSTVCAPSRAALLTGFHTGHGHVRGNRNDLPLAPDQRTIAEVLRGAGYATGAIGKWGFAKPGSPNIPTRRGFDEFFGYLEHVAAHRYYPAFLWRNEERVVLPGNAHNKRGDYAHDRLTSAALDFLQGHKTGKPFFLYLAFTTPHARLEPPDDTPYSQQTWPQNERNFAAMVSRLDASVGQVMKRLRDLGIDDNTLIVFTSDNGPHAEGHQATFFRSSGPLRGIKRDLYEGGIRVPLIARWPGRVVPGTTSDQVVAFWDVLPTLAEAANAVVPEKGDGVSFLPALFGKQRAPHAPLYWEFHERGFEQAIRLDDWKAIRHGTTKPIELYNLVTDPGEATDVAAQHPSLVARMERLFQALRTDSPLFPIDERPRNKRQTQKQQP